MPKIEPKKLSSQLKNNEIYNLYYLFGQNITGVETITKAIIKTTVGKYQDFALTKINGKSLNISDLADRIEMIPMMAEYNCIFINDFNAEEQREETLKSLIQLLKEIPPQTVIIFNITGFDIKNGKKNISPKNKKITDLAEKIGILCECGVPSKSELIKFVIARANKNGCSISPLCAEELTDYCLNDTLTISNEIQKLCSYVGNGEITSETLKLLVIHQTDIDVFKLANAVCRFDRNTAFQALDELLAQKVERSKIVFAISNSFIDIYRASVAKKHGKQVNQVAEDFGYARDFVVKNAFRDSTGISVKRLRKCVSILRDTAVTLNSTGNNERVVMEKAIAKMLILSD